jgi:hypothetical protein
MEVGVVTFNSKIGTWGFVKLTPTNKKSTRRYRGELKLKSVKVTRDVMRQYLCGKVIPDIQDLGPMMMKEEQSSFNKITQDLMSSLVIRFFYRS